MRYKKLDLNLLSALHALLAEKSVTRAAEIVHLTQSAMSSALSRLRQYFDDPLIVQVGRAMELTPLAQRLEAHVNDVLLHIDTAICTLPDFDAATTDRHFTIVASEYATSVVLCGALERAQRIAQGITLTIVHPSRPTAEELDNRETDFVITLQPYAEPSQPSAFLYQDTDVVICDLANPNVGERITLEQYLQLRRVTYRVAHFGYTMLERLQGEGDIQSEGQHGDVVVDSFHLVPRFVAGTDRIATLPHRIAAQYAELFPLRLVAPDFDIPPVVELLQWHHFRDYDPACVWFRQQIQAVAASLSQPQAT